MNQNGVFFSLSLIQHILVPSILGGFLSAVVYGLGEHTFNGSTSLEIGANRPNGSQGAIQLLGMAFSMGIGLLAGFIIGLFYCCFNRH